MKFFIGSLLLLLMPLCLHASQPECRFMGDLSRISVKHQKYGFIIPETGDQFRLEFRNYVPKTGAVEASVTLVTPMGMFDSIDDDPTNNMYVRIGLQTVEFSSDKKEILFSRPPTAGTPSAKFKLVLEEPFDPLTIMKVKTYTASLAEPVGDMGPFPGHNALLDFQIHSTNQTIIRTDQIDFYELEKTPAQSGLREYRLLVQGPVGEVSIRVPELKKSGPADGTSIFYGFSKGHGIKFNIVRISPDGRQLKFTDTHHPDSKLTVKLNRGVNSGDKLSIGSFEIDLEGVRRTEKVQKILKTIDTQNINYMGKDADQIRDVIEGKAHRLSMGSLYLKGLLYRDSLATIIPGNSTITILALLHDLKELGLNPSHPIFNLSKHLD